MRRIGERLQLIPRYRMRLDPAPLGVASPVWVADESFEVERHVRRAARAIGELGRAAGAG
jgi:diacylglycerol O-acyltransferase / wax synthase